MPLTDEERSAIDKAARYLEYAGIRGFRMKSVKYLESKSPSALLGDHVDLLAELDESELQVVKDFGRSGWAVSYEYEDNGTEPAPNAPTVYVYDDGEVSHVTPM